MTTQEPIRDNARRFAKLVGQNIREEQLDDTEYVDSVVKLALTLAPHLTLTDKLQEAAESQNSSLGVFAEILKTARIAELSSFGQIADTRVHVISRVEALKNDPATLEEAFQQLISGAPWLIDPNWSPITSNQSFSTLKTEFERYYEKKHKVKITINDFQNPSKRADFVLDNMDGVVEIIEIKRPSHGLQNDEMDRIITYIDTMTEFFENSLNKSFTGKFERYHLTLVCDSLKLVGAQKAAFDGYVSRGLLLHLNWTNFLLRTKKMHQEFLNEAERQKANAAKS